MKNTHGCFTIIINENNEILLVKRRDYPLWDLPGGRLEESETFIECAIREALEETGYPISIDYKIGTYHRIKYNDTQHIYLGKVIALQQAYSTEESKELRWFNLNKIPLNMVPHRRRQIKDYQSHYQDISVELKDSHLLLLVQRIKKYL